MRPSNVIEYKGYYALIRYNANDDCLYGELAGIVSHISFYNFDKPIIEAFHEAVDDYLAWCEEEGSEPERPYKGQFNVRIKPELHRKAAFKGRSIPETRNKASQ